MYDPEVVDSAGLEAASDQAPAELVEDNAIKTQNLSPGPRLARARVLVAVIGSRPADTKEPSADHAPAVTNMPWMPPRRAPPLPAPYQQ